MNDKIALSVITKYLKKGNMSRCLRDILPSSGLSKQQREEIAEIVHNVVRWKNLYEYITEKEGKKASPEVLLRLAKEGAQSNASSFPFEYRFSCSQYVASVLALYSDWAEYLNESPPTSLCVNHNTSTVSDVITLLQKEQLPAERSIIETCLLSTSVSKYSSVVQQKYAHIQDENSQLVAALALHLGDSVFDYCAGNGGKSLAMASQSKNKKELSAYELNEAKRRTLFQRCREYHAKVTIEDHPTKQQYDVVLVDAPCTGLGAARRNPEAKYIPDPGDLPKTQLSLLSEAARNVKKGGFLIYAVCTFTPEETHQVIASFLKKTSCTLLEFQHPSYQKFLQTTNSGVFTMIPRGDIFYLSLLKKT